jgi:hypothetical protein
LTRLETKTRRLRKEVSCIVADLTQTRRGKAKTREISPRKATKMTKKKSLVRTARTRMHTIRLTDALLRIRSFDANRNKRQARHLYHIRRKRSQTKKAEKTSLTITTSQTIKTVVSSAKDSNYLCVYLNKKNRLLIKQDRTLFNIGAETYIVKSINNFNASTYTPASLLAIDTASEEARLLGFGKRTLICTTNTNKETYTLNLSKV